MWTDIMRWSLIDLHLPCPNCGIFHSIHFDHPQKQNNSSNSVRHATGSYVTHTFFNSIKKGKNQCGGLGQI